MAQKRLAGVFIIIGVTILVFLGFKFLLPLFLPFFLAFIIAYLFEPLLKRVSRHVKMNRGVLAAILLVVIGGTAVILLWQVGKQILLQSKYLSENYHFYEMKFQELIKNCCYNVETTFGVQAEMVEKTVNSSMNVFMNNIQVNLLPDLLKNCFAYIKKFLEVSGIGIIILISVVLIAKDFPMLKETNRQYFYYKSVTKSVKNLFHLAGGYIKAQLTIMVVIMSICVVSFFIMRNPYALLAGIGIGLLDALPIFGTGIVFVPWTLFELFLGNFSRAAACLTIYIICSMAREFLEPKLVGNRLGIPSITLLMSVYAGLKLFGVSGVFLGPAGYMLIMEIVKEIFEEYHITLKNG